MVCFIVFTCFRLDILFVVYCVWLLGICVLRFVGYLQWFCFSLLFCLLVLILHLRGERCVCYLYVLVFDCAGFFVCVFDLDILVLCFLIVLLFNCMLMWPLLWITCCLLFSLFACSLTCWWLIYCFWVLAGVFALLCYRFNFVLILIGGCLLFKGLVLYIMDCFGESLFMLTCVLIVGLCWLFVWLAFGIVCS